jgi:hypothetical protein
MLSKSVRADARTGAASIDATNPAAITNPKTALLDILSGYNGRR